MVVLALAVVLVVVVLDLVVVFVVLDETETPAKMHLQALVTPRGSLIAVIGDVLCGSDEIQLSQKAVGEGLLAFTTAMLLCTLLATQVVPDAKSAKIQLQALVTPRGSAMFEKPEDA